MPPTLLRTRILPAFAIAALAVTLVGCANGSGPTQSAGSDCTQPGASSDKIEVTGDAGDTPTVDFPAPLTTTETERTVVTEGDGDAAKDGSSVGVNITAFNATTGDPVAALTATDQTFVIGDELLPTINEALICSTPGTRVAAVIPPIEGIEQSGQDVGLGANDSVVLVIDVTDVGKPAPTTPPADVLPKADGVDQPLPEGFPAVEVTRADDGTPTVTIPPVDPPADLQIATLKKGDGATVEDGASVTVHYTGLIWATGAIFDSSWTRGEPSTFPTDGVIEGFSKALVGQTVGSQVVALIPPAQGYGDSPAEGSGISPTDTLVFIVDILATQ